MSAILHSYSLMDVFLTVGGIPISGYGADEGVVIEPSADIVEITTGATGLDVASRINNFGATMQITVLEAARSYRDLGALMKAQELEVGAILPLAVQMIDIVNGDKISASHGVFLSRPEMSKRSRVGTRVFGLYLPNGMRNAEFGVLNLL